MRIQKYLSQCGYCSRRHAEVLISEGQITVNGKIVTDLGTKINPDKDKIHVNGELIQEYENKIYLAFNKPAGVTSTLSDVYAEITVPDMVKSDETLKIAGRLDKETEGLMLLSNDGDFIYKVTHPSFECEKEYIGRTYDSINENAFKKILRGGEVYGEYYHPARGEMLASRMFRMILHEGKKRQIRNMMQSIRAQVKALKRVRVGIVELGDLPLGKTRELSTEEVNYFLNLKKSQKYSKM